MKYIGPHLSIAGGVFNAPDRAVACGANGFAIFTKNQRQWQAPEVTDEEAREFADHLKAGGFSPKAVLPHDSYLINLGNPDNEKRKRATEAFVAEMHRVEAFGLTALNFHPGSSLGAPMDETLVRIAEAIKIALKETERVVAVIENTAGQGHVAGGNLQELQRLLELVGDDARCGVCIDTCHAYAAGFDIATPEGLDAFWKEFDERIGFKALRGMHLNDTKSKLGSHLDRHAPIGDGFLGWDTFLRIVKDSRIDEIPMILETPDDTLWPEETRRLREAL
ncbi:MAG: deoxyribonuclease IV [Lentisphaeria bacterium]|nr:deoxyribonuclease IV [Lentisphaeria bacterium]